MPQAVVEEIVRDAAATLRTSFGNYWPTYGDTGAHERNISLHIGHAFLARKFSVFGEGHSQGPGAEARYDLLAYSPEERIFVAAEFKQLWSKNIAGFENDLCRLRAFKPVKRNDFDVGEVTLVRLLAAFAEADYEHLKINGLDFKSEMICESHGRQPDRHKKKLCLFFATETESGA